MAWSVLRDLGSQRLDSVHYESERRTAWIGRTGMGFGNGLHGYNSHWYDLSHPWQRYSMGERRIAFFFGQLWRGLSAFIRGETDPDDDPPPGPS